MEKKYLNPEVLELDNQKLEEAMKVYMEAKTPESLVDFIKALKDAKFLVPVDFPKKIDPAVMEKMKNKERLKPEELPRMMPVLVVNKDGVRFAPAFTAKEHLPENHKYNVIMTVDFVAVLQVANAKDTNTRGILINPGSTKLILNPKLLTLMEKVVKGMSVEDALKEAGAAESGEKKEIRMTPEQFHVFIRRNVEVGLLPKLAFQEKGKFMERISKDRELAVMNIYKSLYKDQAPFPYTEDDFDIMDLEISDTLSVTAIGLPEKNLAPGICQSVYLVWNPQTDEVQYYTIEKTKDADDNKLGCVTLEGKYEIIGDAPAHGSELYGIIEMLEAQN
ncbi:Uncharacterised protein [uncultured Roseburia sp.]|uniref:SseB family protein n=1 Tax=Brotonthovivens ammoniilytica TaxID=2981725 RepID=A0ABT2TFM7_9FIRM|nr:SseB family protein [Brotonthovivens ammoniilytica]MCU6760980.1 SseB family protein [Brotonthovivens ammoniilytica]SCI15281.1 Uncharacterised protein [uncultured Roseburia sp.]